METMCLPHQKHEQQPKKEQRTEKTQNREIELREYTAQK